MLPFEIILGFSVLSQIGVIICLYRVYKTLEVRIDKSLNYRVDQLIETTKRYWYKAGKLEVAFIGPKGEQGEQGPIGPQGYPGLKGDRGPKGDVVLLTSTEGEQHEVVIRDAQTNEIISRRNPTHPDVIAAQLDDTKKITSH